MNFFFMMIFEKHFFLAFLNIEIVEAPVLALQHGKQKCCVCKAAIE